MKRIILSAMAAVLGAAACIGQNVQLPAPAKTGGKAVVETLWNRQSGTEFGERMLSLQDLSTLLFAAVGVNREDGRLTSPTARNRQEIRVFVFTAEGVCEYLNKENALKSGIVNHIIELLGGERIHFMAEPSWFRPLYIGSEIWQSAGWGSILYLAALSGINPELHEAAIMDGANKFQRVWHIDIPGILPTIVIMFILNSGKIMAVGQEKALLMQTSLNQSTSEIISTYVYKRGLQNHQYSFATAVGMFESVVNLVLLCTVNFVSKRMTESSLF